MKAHALRQSGFTLVEVALAVGVAAFCLMVVFALFPVGMHSNQNAAAQTMAASIATTIAADLRATPIANPKSTALGLTLPTSSSTSLTQTLFFREDGSPIGAVNSDAVASAYPRFRATVTLVNTTTATANPTASARIFITWPALSDAKASALPDRYQGSFEAAAGIDRN